MMRMTRQPKPEGEHGGEDVARVEVQSKLF